MLVALGNNRDCSSQPRESLGGAREPLRQHCQEDNLRKRLSEGGPDLYADVSFCSKKRQGTQELGLKANEDVQRIMGKLVTFYHVRLCT